MTDITNYGAIPDGVTDASAAIAAMDATLGFVVVPEGLFAVGNLTISGPLSFAPGGALTIALGATLTLGNTINAPRQWVFRGDGNVSVSGKLARVVHVAWFGALADRPSVNEQPFLQKAASIVDGSDVTECVFRVGNGTYYMNGQVVWGRASRIVGDGDRVSHFRTSQTEGDVFVTSALGVRFERIQMTCPSKRTSGAYIALLHPHCRATEISADYGFEAVRIGNSLCAATKIRAAGGSNAAGSCMVRLAAGDDAVIDDLAYTNYSSPADMIEACVLVDGGANSTRQPRISRIAGRGAQEAVKIRVSGAGSVFNATVRDVGVYFGMSDRAVSVVNEGTGEITGTIIDGVQAERCNADCILIDRRSTGTIKGTTIGSHALRSVSGAGIKVTGAGASLPQDVQIASGIAHQSGGDGYDILADGATLMGNAARSNAGAGIRIRAGAANYIVRGNRLPSNAAGGLIDDGGAVAKSVGDNL